MARDTQSVQFHSLEELARARQEWINVSKENNFQKGIFKILSDLYPDTAHFVYELLQNAEDMDATEVVFDLRETYLDFRHNGTKRDFNLADIAAITGIGDSQKRNDETSIGKFGIGFKAVFAYTTTPEIESGPYHFRIRDNVIPEDMGTSGTSSRKKNGVSWTKFHFPFNHPKKKAARAYEEILETLEELDDSSILFLKNIKKIQFTTPSSEIGSVTLYEPKENYIKTVCQDLEGNSTTKTWLRFQKTVNFTNEDGDRKKLAIAIAYALEKGSKNKPDKIIPLSKGKTFIYFPAQKEYSGLRFHINGPFASTVARESVRDCEENSEIFEEIAELVTESLARIKKLGLLTISFLEVLPNDYDELDDNYDIIRQKIFEAFEKNKYLQAKEGGYILPSQTIIGPDDISDLLTDKIIKHLTEKNSRWIEQIPSNSRSENFIQYFEIETFSYDEFDKLFDGDAIEEFLAKQTKDFLVKFYSLCYLICERNDGISTEMKNSKIVKCSNGKMYSADEIFISPSKEQKVSDSAPFVDPYFLQKDNVQKDKIKSKIFYQSKKFITDYLEINEYNEIAEIEHLLLYYEKNPGKCVDSEKYYSSLLEFIDYQDKIDFSKYKFLFDDSEEAKMYAPQELLLSKAYGCEVGEELDSIYKETHHRYDHLLLYFYRKKHSHDLPSLIGEEYAAHYTKKQLEVFIKFLISIGVKTGVEIIEQDARGNPLYYKKLRNDKTETSYRISTDWTILRLEEILQKQSYILNLNIWNCVKELRNEKYCKATYTANNSDYIRNCESSLVYYLKEYAWVPDQEGNFYKPSEITIDEIHKDFVFDEESPILKVLDFGCYFEEKAKEKRNLESKAEEYDYKLISKEEHELITELLQINGYSSLEDFKRKRTLAGEKKSLRELLSEETREPQETFGSERPSRRRSVSKNQDVEIQETFRHSSETPQSKKMRLYLSTVSPSNAEEKEYLREQYDGVCQFCGTRIRRYKGGSFFYARNIIPSRKLPEEYRGTEKIAWNSLCLCPTCAEKYVNCSKDITPLYDQIMETPVDEDDSEPIEINFILDEETQTITYTPHHFFALRECFKIIDEVGDEEE